MTSSQPSRVNTKRATIKSVAERAKVSITTVSLALNNRPGISEETRQAVFEAARALNYMPDKAAQQLSTKQIRHIGLNNSFGARRLGGFQSLFREYLFAALQLRGFRPEEIPCQPNGLPERLAELMVLTGLMDDDPRVPFLRKRGVPFVVLGHTTQKGVSWVVPDGYDGSRQATEHLIRLGHEDILILAGNATPNYTARAPFLWQVSSDRFRGYQDALEAAGIPLKRDLIVNGDFTTLGGFFATRNALRDGKRFTAIHAITDELAAGAIAALEDAGLRVPADVSVVGFDDMPEVGEHFTTVHQDIEHLAHLTVDLVLEALEGKPPRQINMPVHLVVRGTTARRR